MVMGVHMAATMTTLKIMLVTWVSTTRPTMTMTSTMTTMS